MDHHEAWEEEVKKRDEEQERRIKPPSARAEPRKPKVSFADIEAAFERNKGEL
jgi:hypothetical protein